VAYVVSSEQSGEPFASTCCNISIYKRKCSLFSVFVCCITEQTAA